MEVGKITVDEEIVVLEQRLAAWKHTAEAYERRCEKLMRWNMVTLVASISTLLTALVTVGIFLMK